MVESARGEWGNGKGAIVMEAKLTQGVVGGLVLQQCLSSPKVIRCKWGDWLLTVVWRHVQCELHLPPMSFASCHGVPTLGLKGNGHAGVTGCCAPGALSSREVKAGAFMHAQAMA